jgi:hypothetical protein
MNQDTSAPTTAKIEFHYLKSPDYREVACHGVIGGNTPQGKIWMSFFAERPPIPRVVQFDVPSVPGATVVQFDEGAATPTHVETRNGLIRHIEISTYMDVEIATRVHKWLGDRLAELSPPETKK